MFELRQNSWGQWGHFVLIHKSNNFGLSKCPMISQSTFQPTLAVKYCHFLFQYQIM